MSALYVLRMGHMVPTTADRLTNTLCFMPAIDLGTPIPIPWRCLNKAYASATERAAADLAQLEPAGL